MIAVATLNTGHFEFMALGRSEHEAKYRVVRGFEKHLMTYLPEHRDMTDKQVRLQWVKDVDFQIDDLTFEAFADAVEEWYGIQINEFSGTIAAVCNRDGVAIA